MVKYFLLITYYKSSGFDICLFHIVKFEEYCVNKQTLLVLKYITRGQAVLIRGCHCVCGTQEVLFTIVSLGVCSHYKQLGTSLSHAKPFGIS